MANIEQIIAMDASSYNVEKTLSGENAEYKILYIGCSSPKLAVPVSEWQHHRIFNFFLYNFLVYQIFMMNFFS